MEKYRMQIFPIFSNFFSDKFGEKENTWMLFAKIFEQMESYLIIFAETLYHKLSSNRQFFLQSLPILRTWQKL
jgi:hypothetical protein